MLIPNIATTRDLVNGLRTKGINELDIVTRTVYDSALAHHLRPSESSLSRSLMARTNSLKIRIPPRPPLYRSPFQGIRDTSGLWNEEGAGQIVIRARSHLFRVDRRRLSKRSRVFRAVINGVLLSDSANRGPNYCPWVEVYDSPSDLRVLLHFLCDRYGITT